MKVWIVHDSNFGNGKSLAEAMGEVFRQQVEVGIGHVKKVSPKEVAGDKPVLIIVGTAMRAFSTSLASKIWIYRLKTQLRKVNHIVPLGVVFITHAMPKKMVEFWGKRFHKILDRGIAIAEVYPDWLSGRVIDTKGPLEEGTTENFVHIAQQLLNNILK
jgi:hypothetical protein